MTIRSVRLGAVTGCLITREKASRWYGEPAGRPVDGWRACRVGSWRLDSHPILVFVVCAYYRVRVASGEGRLASGARRGWPRRARPEGRAQGGRWPLGGRSNGPVGARLGLRDRVAGQPPTGGPRRGGVQSRRPADPSAGDDGVRLWPSLGSWVEMTCERAGRNLTQREWDEFVGSDMDYFRTCPEFHPERARRLNPLRHLFPRPDGSDKRAARTLLATDNSRNFSAGGTGLGTLLPLDWRPRAALA